MPFTIPNAASATFADQAQIDSEDIDTLAAGMNLTGVLSGGVTGTTGSANASVSVALGVGRVAGRRMTWPTATLQVAANATGNPRYDAITVPAATGTASASAAVLITGTAAAAPAYPVVSATSLLLGVVRVPTGTTSGSTLVANQFVDKRVTIADGPYEFVGWYGITFDGSTDDATAWNNMFTAWPGRWFVCPPGISVIGATLNFPDYTRLTGVTAAPFNSAGQSILQAKSGTLLLDVMKNTNLDTTDYWVHGGVIENLVFKGNASAGGGAVVQSAVTAGSGTLAAATYYYRITATTAQGESIAGNEQSRVTSASTGNVLTWTATPGATGYKIYRSTTQYLSHVFLASVGAVTTYTDDGSATPTGAVAPAYNTAGNLGCGLRWCPGENSYLSNVQFRNFPMAGFHLQKAPAPASFMNLGFYNNNWGWWIDNCGGGGAVSGMTGDDNRSIVAITNSGSNPNSVGAGGTLTIFNIKVECSAALADQNSPVILVRGGDANLVQLIGGKASDHGQSVKPGSKAFIDIQKALAPVQSAPSAAAGGSFAANTYFWVVSQTFTQPTGFVGSDSPMSNEVTSAVSLNQQVTLTWSNVAAPNDQTTVSGTKIYRGTVSGTWLLVATVGAGVTSYVDTGTAGSGSNSSPYGYDAAVNIIGLIISQFPTWINSAYSGESYLSPYGTSLYDGYNRWQKVAYLSYRTPVNFHSSVNDLPGAFALRGTNPLIRMQKVGGTTEAYILSGTGAPAMAAPSGSIYLRTDGASGSNFYVKTSGTGTTVWTAVAGV